MLDRVRRLARGLLLFLLRTAVVIVFLEGAASWLTFALGLPDALEPPIAERLHTRYDPELGWSNVPDTHLPDFYGPGRDLTINAQGFRGDRVYGPRPDGGRLRAICSGDSFTLGYGVDDADTWCARLETLEPRLESVNMGQGGYGIDQAYLWYRRDGIALSGDLLLFAFIREDFGRMQSDHFLHYGKPRLRVTSDDRLEVQNVPVPQAAFRSPWLVQNLALLEKLRFVQLARPAVRGLAPDDEEKLTMPELAALSLRVFAELDELATAQGGTLVLVYLPTREDYKNPRDLWRRRITREARQRGIAVVDLVEDLKTLSRREAAGLYIPDGSIDFPGADGHFNALGNAWVAEQLRGHLRRMPQLAAALGPSPQAP